MPLSLLLLLLLLQCSKLLVLWKALQICCLGSFPPKLQFVECCIFWWKVRSCLENFRGSYWIFSQPAFWIFLGLRLILHMGRSRSNIGSRSSGMSRIKSRSRSRSKIRSRSSSKSRTRSWSVSRSNSVTNWVCFNRPGSVLQILLLFWVCILLKKSIFFVKILFWTCMIGIFT